MMEDEANAEVASYAPWYPMSDHSSGDEVADDVSFEGITEVIEDSGEDDDFFEEESTSDDDDDDDDDDLSSQDDKSQIHDAEKGQKGESSGSKRRREEEGASSDTMAALQKGLECPICMEIYSGKVFQCREGHTVCESCLKRLGKSRGSERNTKKCPQCRAPIGKIRVRALEVMAEALDKPCGFVGCTFKGKGAELKFHKKTCIFKPMKCPIWWPGGDVHRECKWKGSPLEVEQHLREEHNVGINASNPECQSYIFENPEGHNYFERSFIIKKFGHTFLYPFARSFCITTPITS